MHNINYIRNNPVEFDNALKKKGERKCSEKVLKINVIRCTNITDNDATVDFDVEVSGSHKKIANEVTVPANSVVDIVDKNASFYLQETDLLRGGASAATTIDVMVSYEIMDDA